jgi:small subunit ribosomal protein S5
METGFIDRLVSLRRVTKVTKGGKNFTFSAFVVSGDQAGSVGVGTGKSREATEAIRKATRRARSSLISVAVRGTTLPYDVKGQHGASSVILRPAYKGTGLIAGGAVRAVMEAAGVKDVLAKAVGTSRSAQNVVKATLNALAKCRSIQDLARLRGKSVEELIKGAEHNVKA